MMRLRANMREVLVSIAYRFGIVRPWNHDDPFFFGKRKSRMMMTRVRANDCWPVAAATCCNVV